MGFLGKLLGLGTDENVDLKALIDNGAYLVDVRSKPEFQSGSVKGAVNIPLETIAQRADDLKNKENIIVFCRSGNRSAQAKRVLESKGLTNVYNGGSVNDVFSLKMAK